MYPTHSFITEALCLSTYIQLYHMTDNVNSQLTQLKLTLIRLVSMMHFNYKATPTNDTDYSYHIKAVNFV